MKEFRLLSYEEETKLDLEDKIQYYINLKKYLKDLKQPLSQKLYLNLCAAMNKHGVRFVLDKIKPYELEVQNSQNIPSEPVIFASTHQNLYDHFNIVLAIPSHAIILNNINVSKFVKIAMGVNGIEYVDRNNPASRYTSKINLMKYIAKGKSIVVFPEGTYNCSPNKLILPIHSGVIDISRKMQVPIVPVVQEYFYTDDLQENDIKKCIVRFGKPIDVKYEDDIETKKMELKESLATMRYDIMSENGISKRTSVSDDEYIDYLISKLKIYESVKTTYEDETSSIYGIDDDFYRYFSVNATEEHLQIAKSKIKVQ